MVGLTAFLVIDVALVALAWQHTHRTPDSTVGADPTIEPSPDHGDDDGAATERYLTALKEDGTALRATYHTPPCEPEQSVTVSRSADGGSTFQSLEHPPLTSVADVDLGAGGTTRVIGTDDNCQPVTLVSKDGGKAWQQRSRDDATIRWAVLSRRSQLGSPGGVVTPPCQPASVTGVDEQTARLLCRGGDLYGTDDSGDTWTAYSELPGAPIAVDWASATRGYGLSETDECGALVSATANGGESWIEAHCAGATGQGLSVQGETVLVLTTEGAVISRDAGATWEAA